MVKDFEIVRKNALSSNPVQLLDARGQKRYDKARIPQALSTPYAEMFNDDRTIKSDEELIDFFKSKGADLSAETITSCGSGITACVTALALYKATNMEVAVFDGSFTEWKIRAPHLMTKNDEANK